MKFPVYFITSENTNESSHEELEALRLSSARKAGRGDPQRRGLDGLGPSIFWILLDSVFAVLGLKVLGLQVQDLGFLS